MCVFDGCRSGSRVTVATVARRSSGAHPVSDRRGRALRPAARRQPAHAPFHRLPRALRLLGHRAGDDLRHLRDGARSPRCSSSAQLPDRVGRRRVIAGGLGAAALGLLLLALAQSTAWLFVARAVQGLALGTVGSAAARAGGARARRRYRPRRAGDGAGPERRRRGPAARRRPGAVGAGAAPALLRHRHRADRRGGARRAAHPGAAPAQRRVAPAAPTRPRRLARRVRAGEPDRRVHLGRRRAVPVGRAVLRGQAASTPAISRCSAPSAR